MIYYFFIVVMTIIGAFAGFFLKKASSCKSIIFSINLYIGALLYFITAIMNILFLKKLPYSVVLPLTSITYIWTLLLAYYVLKEKITTKKIVGICMIVIGAVLLVK